MISPLLKTTFRTGIGLLPTQAIARAYRPVLNYHACFAEIPPSVAPVDNISPEWLYRHLEALRKTFRFVPIDEFSETRAERVAALTFDDGYTSVLESGLAVCEALDIPLTMFLNTRSFDRIPFWRHKVMYVIENGLVAECERSFRKVRKVEGLEFYHYLKHPSNCSPVVEAEVDAFLHSKRLNPGRLPYLADQAALRQHRLLTYGNHTHNHYVLSSLNYEQHFKEIETTRRILQSIPGLQISSVFSPPFGQTKHINRDTLAIVRELGYKAILLNRGQLNRRVLESCEDLSIVERFSPASSAILPQLKREALRTAAGARSLSDLQSTGGGVQPSVSEHAI
jgi:peptidoglycan/xylan/chitin deacetylase (PgdA/CDA1 family)